MYQRDPDTFNAKLARLGVAREELEAAEEQWLELEMLREENARLTRVNQEAFDYIRDKVNSLLEVIGTKNLRPEELDDVLIGCAMPEGPQGLNLARRVALHAGLPVEVPAETINQLVPERS
mgnify:CR=1 FL=1